MTLYKFPGHIWCLHCRRTYKQAEARKEHAGVKGEWCAYEGCNGSVFADGFRWSQIRKNHPEYPVKPKPNTEYELY